MREIKFRAWDKMRCEMVPVWQLIFAHGYGKDGKPIKYVIDEWSGPVKFVSAYRSMPPEEVETGRVGITITQDKFFSVTGYELMQYTGLHDKYGVEIYEGDIVIDASNRNSGWRAAIEWTDLSFDLSNEHPAERNLWELAERGRLEVIGNIYEHPELIGAAE